MEWGQLSEAEKQAHWGRSEADLTALIDWAKAHVPNGQLEWVKEFLDHAEYGLALEHLYELLFQSQVQVPRSEIKRMTSLAEHMGIEDTIHADRLRQASDADPVP